MRTLKQIIKEEKLSILDHNIANYGTDKDIHPYVDEYYDEHFLKFRTESITLVEIGVRGGASLSLWKNYFINAKKIYGLDNLDANNNYDVPINKDWVSGDNVEYIVGDAYTIEIANKIPDSIDIFIDDGPHTVESHIKSIELYLPKMSNNGIFIIEDISYNFNNILYEIFPKKYRDNVIVYNFDYNMSLLTLDMSKCQ
jgi:hypothetical protein